MPKHSSKTLLAHGLQLQAIMLQLDALALSHPAFKQAFGMATTMLQTIQLPSAGTTVKQLQQERVNAGPTPPYDAPDEGAEDDDAAEALPAPQELDPKAFS